MDKDARLIFESFGKDRRETLEDFDKARYKLERSGVGHVSYLRRDWRSRIKRASRAWKDDPEQYAFDTSDAKIVLVLKTLAAAEKWRDHVKGDTGIELSIVWSSTQPGDEDVGGYV
jgi:hypothetical protein